MESDFFDEQSDESLAKARIVSKYFDAWSSVIGGAVKRNPTNVAYLDLFCGPGRYADASPSTPIMVLEKALTKPFLTEHLIAIFNDANADHVDRLRSEISKISGIENFRHRPRVENMEVSRTLIDAIRPILSLPKLSFVDPFGYKAISRELILSLIRSWGSDSIFFLNYRRVNAALSNSVLADSVMPIFGSEWAAKLRASLTNQSPASREAMILESLAGAFKEVGGRFVLPFIFRNPNGTRTTHALVFVSKDVKGFEIMKEIMAKESSVSDQGVPSFAYSPADKQFPLLFSLAQPLDALEGMLMDRFAGQSLRMIDVYDRHHVGYRYVKRNYKDALLNLERRGDIQAIRRSRRLDTLGDEVSITFSLARR